MTNQVTYRALTRLRVAATAFEEKSMMFCFYVDVDDDVVVVVVTNKGMLCRFAFKNEYTGILVQVVSTQEENVVRM